MAKYSKKAKLRLERRTDNAPKKNQEMYNPPGSRNAHKCYPLGKGRRSRGQVRSDSQMATNR